MESDPPSPDVKDMKLLATALKLHSKFETLDRLATDWYERNQRQVDPSSLEEYERREWYDLADKWERAVSDLTKTVRKFQSDTGHSPILGYVQGEGKPGKIFLGYDSPQARGYRIVLLGVSQWFEELNLPTEMKTEEEVLRLVPSPVRLTPEQEEALRSSFVDDLKEAGIDALTHAIMDRFALTVDTSKTYNENVFNIDDLVQTIIREHALAIPTPPGPITIAAPPGERLWAREKTREDAEGDVKTFENAGLTCRIIPVSDGFEVWCTGELKRPIPKLPTEVKPRLWSREEFYNYFDGFVKDNLPFFIEQHKPALSGNLHYEAPKFEAETLAKFTVEEVKRKYGDEIERRKEDEYRHYQEVAEGARKFVLEHTPDLVRQMSADLVMKLYNELLDEAKAKARMPSTVKSYADLEKEFEGKDPVDALAAFISGYYGLRRDYLLEDLNRYMRSLRAKLSQEDIFRFYRVYPGLKESFAAIAGFISWVPPPPPAPVTPPPAAPPVKPSGPLCPVHKVELMPVIDLHEFPWGRIEVPGEMFLFQCTLEFEYYICSPGKACEYISIDRLRRQLASLVRPIEMAPGPVSLRMVPRGLVTLEQVRQEMASAERHPKFDEYLAEMAFTRESYSVLDYMSKDALIKGFREWLQKKAFFAKGGG